MRVVIAVSLLFLSATAPLQGIADTDVDEQASTQFEWGKALFRAGRYLDAADAFRQAYELKSSWKLFYNIGQCEAAAKRYGLALEAFERYLARGGDEVPPDRSQEVLQEVERLRKMVGVLELRGEEGDSVEVNDVLRGRLPESERVKVSMGRVEVRVLRGKDEVLSKSFVISGEETVTLEVPGVREAEEPQPVEAEVSPEPRAPQPADEDEGVEGAGFRTAAFVSWGVGGAALLGGAIVGGVALATYKDVEDTCREDGYCSPSKEGDADTIRPLTITADVLFGVGIAGAVLGAVFYWGLAPDDGDEMVAVSAAPMSENGGVVVSVSGGF